MILLLQECLVNFLKEVLNPNFLMAKSNFQKISYDVISVTSSLLRHRKTSQTNTTIFFHFESFSIKISGYASAHKSMGSVPIEVVKSANVLPLQLQTYNML